MNAHEGIADEDVVSFCPGLIRQHERSSLARMVYEKLKNSLTNCAINKSSSVHTRKVKIEQRREGYKLFTCPSV